MTGKGKKLEPKLFLDLDFEEALERFAQTDPKEVAESIERSKKKKPPGDDATQRPTRSGKSGKSPPENRKRQPSGGS